MMQSGIWDGGSYEEAWRAAISSDVQHINQLLCQAWGCKLHIIESAMHASECSISRLNFQTAFFAVTNVDSWTILVRTASRPT